MVGGASILPAVDADGWLPGVMRVVSPNCDARPDGCEVDLLVIHCISLPEGCYGGDQVQQLFTNCLCPEDHPSFTEIADLEVSAHVYIRRDGSVLQFVPLFLRAWHAGASRFEGRSRCNDFSVGIELEGTDHGTFEDEQYESLAQVARRVMAACPAITEDRIVGHADIAPGRKTDPGPGFDWDRFRVRLRQLRGRETQ